MVTLSMMSAPTFHWHLLSVGSLSSRHPTFSTLSHATYLKYIQVSSQTLILFNSFITGCGVHEVIKYSLPSQLITRP